MNSVTSDNKQMDELFKLLEKGSRINVTQKRKVGSNLKHSKLVNSSSLMHSADRTNSKSKNVNTKVKNEKLKLELPRKKIADISSKQKSDHSDKIRLPRLCRPAVKEEKSTNENMDTASQKPKATQPKDDELYKTFYQIDCQSGSDSLESEYNEERGFKAADRLLMMNNLSKELERRENLIKEMVKEKNEELEATKKTDEEEQAVFAAYDNEINKIIKEHFPDFEKIDDYKKIRFKENESEKVIDPAEDVKDVDSDNSVNDNLEQELLTLIGSMNQRIKDYKTRQTDFDQFFDATEGVTSQKIHNYLQRKLMANTKKGSAEGQLIETGTDFSVVDSGIDVLHPLSTEENRNRLKKLLNDLKSQPFVQDKSLFNKQKVPIDFSYYSKDRSLKNRRKLFNEINIPLSRKHLERSDQSDEEFQIMFSDLSISEEEEEEKIKKKGGKEVRELPEVDQKVEMKQIAEEQVSFKDKCESVMKALKDDSIEKVNKKSRMERLLARYKRKKDQEARKKKEFERWFGGSETKNVNEEGIDVPLWKPNWPKLDKRLKEQVLKDGWESRLRQKKRQEDDPIEEYKRLVKEYEQLEGKIGMEDDQNNVQTGEKGSDEGKKWIKIKKGILMRDYQIRWRQGMYYLVEKKHITKKPKQTLSKKRMIRATKGSKDKNFKKMDVKRYLGKKKMTNKVSDQKKLFLKRGEATKEIRRIISKLESKHFDKHSKTQAIGSRPQSEWTRAKFIHYFKEKCKELSVEVSDDEEDDTRELFRKYCLKYHETRAQMQGNKQKKQDEAKHPLGLFKPKQVNTDDFESESEDEVSFKDDDFPIEDLSNEIFSCWMEGSSEMLNEIYEKQDEGSVNKDSLRQIFGDHFRIEDDFSPQPTKEVERKQSDENKEPRYCSDCFSLSPEVHQLFFGVRSSHERKPLTYKFSSEFESCLQYKPSQSFSKIHTDIVSELKSEGLVKKDNYQYLKKNEVTE